MTPEPVILRRDEAGVRTLTLNRPDKLNAANDEMLLGLTEELRVAGEDRGVRVVVITGAGRGFCAGQDLGAIPAGERIDFSAHLRRTYNPLIRTLRGLDQPVLTAVNGVAAGAGASLALAGDLRLWARGATFTQAFSSIGLIPDSGSTWLLPRAVGYQKAFELMALAGRVGSDEALRLGLCEQVFEDETFAADVQAYAQKLAARPANALALTKRALLAGLGSTLEDALEHEAQAQQQAGDHWEHHEGVQAFREKRPADFRRGG